MMMAFTDKTPLNERFKKIIDTTFSNNTKILA